MKVAKPRGLLDFQVLSVRKDGSAPDEKAKAQAQANTKVHTAAAQVAKLQAQVEQRTQTQHLGMRTAEKEQQSTAMNQECADVQSSTCRTIEMKNRVVTINGVPVKLRGANRHENLPDVGHAITEASMIRDLELQYAAALRSRSGVQLNPRMLDALAQP